MTRRVAVAITGATGSIYGLTLIRQLLRHPIELHLIISATGRKVMAHELAPLAIEQPDAFLPPDADPAARLNQYAPDDFFAPLASGSFRLESMVICPCSMKTLAAISGGHADNLITRAADVCLKEKRPLILVARESPLSRIHLKNMLAATRAGALILPPAPAFYHRPRTIQDLVDGTIGRILDHLKISQTLQPEWGGM